MKLNLQERHIFFEPFSVELSDFTIITGLNGSGKTILLKAIKSGIIKNDITNQQHLMPLLNSNSFQLQTPELSKTGDMPNFVDLYSEYKEYQFNMQNNVEGSIYLEPVVERIANLAGKEKDKLTIVDFETYAPINFSFHGGGGVYNLNFFRLCMFYAQKENTNNYNRFLNLHSGKTHIEYLTSEEFIEIHGEAPWVYINKVFDSMNISYQITTSDFTEHGEHFNIYFINKLSKAKVDFSSLSSGEQVIILTALSIYNVKEKNPQIPKIILMDEPDTSLHPSMIKYFLKVIEEVFVKEKGIKVILTTHNPTTLALAPEESIFVISPTSHAITQTTKDSALNILTEGVPSFSINYENRRQVFVESPYDVKYYERLYEILSDRLNPEISLNFIASGDVQKNGNRIGKNSCDIVKEITKLMRDSGNRFIWGIIDWDRTVNKPECKYVSVLGWESRYSIENYLLDPLLIATIMLREKLILRDTLKLEASDTYIDFKNFDSEKLQSIANIILDKLKPHLTDTEALRNDEYTEATLLNNNKIHLPNWFLHHQGHKLEEAYIKAFDDLKKIKKNKEELLKLEIINKVIDDIPEIISLDLLQILKDIQGL